MKKTKEQNKISVGADASVRASTKAGQNKGITLIALVITIVVMLILVAVTISMAINGGLFGYAGKAAGDTQNAIDAEQQLADGRIKIGDKWYASIDDYINNKPIVKSITIEKVLNLEIEEGYDVTTSTPVTGQLTATLNEIEGTVTWASDNEAVATVSNTGLVTAIADGTAKITASCTFEGETYTGTCNITVEEPKITSSEVSNDLATYLGQPVNYGVTYSDESSYGEGKWEIFYADEDHIYIITKGYLVREALSLTDKDGNAYNGTSDFSEENLRNKYPAVAQGLFDKTYDPDKTPALQYAGVDSNDTSYDNMKATQYLLDSTVWEDYAPQTNEFADWAIGGPTFELFVKSYNAYYPDNEVTLETPTGYSYANPLSTSGSVPSGTYLNTTTGVHYWLAGPGGSDNDRVLRVDCGSEWVSGYMYFNPLEFRPLVCLKSNVKITWNETTSQFDLSTVSEN